MHNYKGPCMKPVSHHCPLDCPVLRLTPVAVLPISPTPRRPLERIPTNAMGKANSGTRLEHKRNGTVTIGP